MNARHRRPGYQAAPRDPITREWALRVFKDGSVVFDPDSHRPAGRYRWGQMVRVDGRRRYRHALAIARRYA